MAGQGALPRWLDKSLGGLKQRGGVFSAGRHGQRQVACVFIIGCAVGLVLGYVLMGTAHAVSYPASSVHQLSHTMKSALHGCN